MPPARLRAARCLAILAIAAPAAHAAQAGDFAACFSLKPGVSYLMDDTKIQIVRERFGERDAIAVISAGSGVRSATFYDASGRGRLGDIQYGIAEWGGDPKTAVITETYSQPLLFPAQATPGGKFKLSGGIGQRNVHSEQEVTELTYQGFTDYTFVGFEDLELKVDYKPRTFAGTCHLRAEVDDGHAEFWYAPGFGMIQFKRYTVSGLLLAQALESVISE